MDKQQREEIRNNLKKEYEGLVLTTEDLFKYNTLKDAYECENLNVLDEENLNKNKEDILSRVDLNRLINFTMMQDEKSLGIIVGNDVQYDNIFSTLSYYVKMAGNFEPMHNFNISEKRFIEKEHYFYIERVTSYDQNIKTLQERFCSISKKINVSSSSIVDDFIKNKDSRFLKFIKAEFIYGSVKETILLKVSEMDDINNTTDVMGLIIEQLDDLNIMEVLRILGNDISQSLVEYGRDLVVINKKISLFDVEEYKEEQQRRKMEYEKNKEISKY